MSMLIKDIGSKDPIDPNVEAHDNSLAGPLGSKHNATWKISWKNHALLSGKLAHLRSESWRSGSFGGRKESWGLRRNFGENFEAGDLRYLWLEVFPLKKHRKTLVVIMLEIYFKIFLRLRYSKKNLNFYCLKKIG